MQPHVRTLVSEAEFLALPESTDKMTDRVYDRVTKRMIYAQAGVSDYWVVEPAGLIERFSGPDLAQVEEVRGRLTTSLLSGYELDLDELFRFAQ